MKKNNLFNTVMLCAGVILASACGRDETPAPEIIPSDGTKLTLQGGEGGGDAINAVYVDLSTDQQTSVPRESWDLGFHSGSAFRVILNNQKGSSAKVTSSSDINSVNSTNFDYSVLASGFEPEKMAHYDDTAGRLDHTVIGEIKDSDADNKVYVINTEFAGTVSLDKLWKVRILKNGTAGYTLQYAKIDDTDFQTVSINKDSEYNFKFFSLTSGEVNVEPKKDEWDFVWSKFVHFTAMGPNVYIPYIFSDLIFTNHLNNVSATEVIVDGSFNVTYEQFDESHLSQISLNSSRNVIGSRWRHTGGPNDPGIGAYKDRYYILKDSANNLYKIKFISMGVNDGGTRGYPELEYKLIKRG